MDWKWPYNLHSDTFISSCVLLKITVISVHDVWTLQICAASHSKWHCCCTLWYTLSNKYQESWNCLKSCSRNRVTYICHHNSSSLYFPHICAFVAFLCLSFITFNYVAYTLNQRHQHICLIWSYNMNWSSLIFLRHVASQLCCTGWMLWQHRCSL